MIELLTVDDVAHITGLSPYTIRAAVRAGELRGHKLRGRIRVHPDDLAAWIDESTVRPIHGTDDRRARTIHRPRPRPTPQPGSVRERLRAARKDAA